MPATATYQCKIPRGGYISNPVAFSKAGEVPSMITMPDGWEPAVYLTIQGSVDGTTFYDLHNADGTEIRAAVIPGSAILLDPRSYQGITAIKLRSGLYNSPVPQTADRNFQIITQV